MTLLHRTTALYDAKPKVVLDVDLTRVKHMDGADVELGAGDTEHTVYVVDEDGNLIGVLVGVGTVTVSVKPW